MTLHPDIIARLGTVSDAALAAEAGVARHRIRYARMKAGLPPARGGDGPGWLETRAIHEGRRTTVRQLLGIVDAVTIAAHVGVSPQRVRVVRAMLGIEAPERARHSIVSAE